MGTSGLIQLIFSKGVLAGILILLYGVAKLYSYKKLNNKKRTQNKAKRNLGILLLLASIPFFLYAAYQSLDLIFQDYSTIEGIYESSYRDHPTSWYKMIISSDDGEETIYAKFSCIEDLEKDSKYEFTYAKRTHVLISVKGVDIKSTESNFLLGLSIPLLLILCFLIYIIACEIISYIWEKRTNSDMDDYKKKDEVIVTIPKFYAIATIPFISLFSLGIAAMHKSESFSEHTGHLVLFGSIIVLGLFVIITSLIWRIVVFPYQPYFMVRSIFGRNHKVLYENCLYYKYHKSLKCIVLKTNREKFYISTDTINFKIFVRALKEHNIMPYKSNRKEKPWKGIRSLKK